MSITAKEALELIKNNDNYLEELEELKILGDKAIASAIHLKRRYAYTGLHRNNQSHWEDITMYWEDLGYTIKYSPNAANEMVPRIMEW
tara:strand:- start:469 stop:732 length:264 start_codon:yes stop_codon:yes gene_type:complete